MVSYYTANKNLEAPARGDYVDDWQKPVNRDWDYLDKAFGGVKIISASGGSQTLTSGIDDTYSYIPLILQIQGAISADITYTIPSGVGGQWVVRNDTTDATTGPWKVIFKNGFGGTGVVLPRGYSSIVASDGYDVKFSDSRPSSAAGTTRQVQYNDAGSLGADANFVYTTASKVGIGTDIPSANLTVQVPENPTNVNLIPEAVASNSYSNGIGFNVGFNGTSWTTLGDATNNGGSYIGSNYTDGSMKFMTVASTGGTDQSVSNATFQTYERARLTADGKLGIGTTTPTQKLEVAGIIYSTTGGIKFPDNTVQTTAGTIQSGTAQVVSGTSVVFTGIPPSAKRITVMFSSISLSGTSRFQVQLGTSGGLQTSSYVSTQSDVGGYNQCAGFVSTNGFLIGAASPGIYNSGTAVFTLFGSNQWVCSSVTGRDLSNFMQLAAGNISLGGALTQLAIVSANGTDTFTAGSINILYE